MTQTRQLLLDNFDEDIHDLLKIQLDAANQRLDKIGRWFWALSKFQLKISTPELFFLSFFFFRKKNLKNKKSK